MKKNILALLTLLCLPGISYTSQAQGCNNPPLTCYKDTLNINTGYDPVNNNYKNPVSLEANWKMTAVPSNTTMNPNGPLWVINPSFAWHNFTNAKWVSPFSTFSYGINNPPSSGLGPFTFQKCFCLCQSATVHIKYKVLADDQAQTFLNGSILLASGIQPNSGHFQFPYELTVDTTITLQAGTHCLSVDLYNVGSGAMGFAVEGFVSGANMLSSVCCNPSASICGTKLKDLNCDGSISVQQDPALPGWTIILYDMDSNPIDSVVTDTFGNYCFHNLPAGTYLVGERDQNGWHQTYPFNPSKLYTFVLSPGATAMANFGNCNQPQPPDPCTLSVLFHADQNACLVKFMSDLSAPMAVPGIKLGGITWTFGDGYSSHELNPYHFYKLPGTYTVCMKATFLKNGVCCTLEYCKSITINQPCQSGCWADALINYNVDHCKYDFDIKISGSGVPIHSVLWDFGDGSTTSGWTSSHVFPAPGTYTVCAILFAETLEGCCVIKICSEITVNCDPCDKDDPDNPLRKGLQPKLNDLQKAPGKEVNFNPPLNQKNTGSITLGDKNSIVLNQNVPNPFAESTVISYNIPAAFRKAEIQFSTTDGRIVKKVNINSKGKGQLTIFADDLSKGLYKYVLIVDGKVIDSKTLLKK